MKYLAQRLLMDSEFESRGGRYRDVGEAGDYYLGERVDIEAVTALDALQQVRSATKTGDLVQLHTDGSSLVYRLTNKGFEQVDFDSPAASVCVVK